MHKLDLYQPLVLFPSAFFIAMLLITDPLLAARMTLIFAGILMIPGYFVVSLLLPEWDELEKTIMGTFFGFGVVTWIVQFAAFFSIPLIQWPVLILISALFFAGVLVLKNEKLHAKAEKILDDLIREIYSEFRK